MVIGHCIYGIYHLSRKAGGRTPASSAAYQLFSAFSDLCILPLYAYGTLAVRNNSSDWGTVLAHNGGLDYLVPALYYTLLGAGGLHLASLTVALWLGLKFRQITLMPPDMNPLEDHLTSRAAHKRNKSSVTTMGESEKRLSTPLEERRRSGVPYEDVHRRGPTIPFAHTRTGSSTTLGSRDSRIELPSRQYQIAPANHSPRSSATTSELSASMIKPPPPPRSQHPAVRARGSYTEIPLGETSPRASTGTVASSQVTIQNGSGESYTPRSAKFTEAWYASDSLINRTQQRNRAVNTMLLNAAGKRRTYDPVRQGGYNDDGVSDEDDDDSDMGPAADENDLGYRYDPQHPNPLRSNPLSPAPAPPYRRPKTPYHPHPSQRPATPGAALSEVSLNDRRVSGSTTHSVAYHPPAGQDIADAKAEEDDEEEKAPTPPRRRVTAAMRDLSKRMTWAAGAHPPVKQRNSSIQPEADFYSKPYGELKAATPPVMQTVGSTRQVSSGTDFDLGPGGRYGAAPSFGRRNVSGRAAEEGMAGSRAGYSRYGGLN